MRGRGILVAIYFSIQFLQSAMSGEMQGPVASAVPAIAASAAATKGFSMFGVLKFGAATAVAAAATAFADALEEPRKQTLKTPATNGSTPQGPAALGASEMPLVLDSELNRSIIDSKGPINVLIDEMGHLFSAGKLLHLQRHAFVTPAGEKRSEIRLVLGDAGARFEQILVRKTLLSDHSCDRMLEDFDALLAQIAMEQHAVAE